MAKLGEWRGGVTSLLPSTAWASPNGLLNATAIRNDDGAYAFNNATSTLTLPATDVADGYLIVGAFTFQDTSNGRHNPAIRIVQRSGTGNFVGSAATGYNRNNAEAIAYCRSWAFVDKPSAGAEFAVEWKRDTDPPSGGTVQAQLQVIPLYYASHGIYSSAQASCSGATTPQAVGGWSVVSEDDTSAIELVGSEVALKRAGSKFLLLGGQYWEGIGAARTQRWHGFTIDGVAVNQSRAYSYARNSANANIGDFFTTLLEFPQFGGSTTVGQFVFRGEDVSQPFPKAGAEAAGNSTGVNPNHAMVILELNDGAQGYYGQSGVEQNVSTGIGQLTDIRANDFGLPIPFGASAFTGIGNDKFRANFDGDALLGASVAGGYASSTGARYQGSAKFTKNGSVESFSENGDYGRGNQGGQSCWGWSASLLGFVACADGDELGVAAGRTGNSAGPLRAFPEWSSAWALDLDSLAPPSAIDGDLAASESGADTADFSGEGSSAVTGDLSAAEDRADSSNFLGTVTVAGDLLSNELGEDVAQFDGPESTLGTLNAAEAGVDAAAFGGVLLVSGDLAALEAGNDAASLVGTLPVRGSLQAAEAGQDVASFGGGAIAQGSLSAAELGGDVAGFTGGALVSGDLEASEASQDTPALSGVVFVRGDLSGSEIGADTAFFSGEGQSQGILTAQEDGDDTAALSGVVIVEGDLQAAETGEDVAGLTGSLPVNGDFAATEAGEDVAALSGGAITQGDFAAVEVGDDVAQLSGALVNSGELDASELGQDAAAFDADLVVSGALDASEAGQDVAQLAGGVVLLGVLAATELGQDSAQLDGQLPINGNFAATELGQDAAEFEAAVPERFPLAGQEKDFPLEGGCDYPLEDAKPDVFLSAPVKFPISSPAPSAPLSGKD